MPNADNGAEHLRAGLNKPAPFMLSVIQNSLRILMLVANIWILVGQSSSAQSSPRRTGPNSVTIVHQPVQANRAPSGRASTRQSALPSHVRPTSRVVRASTYQEPLPAPPEARSAPVSPHPAPTFWAGQPVEAFGESGCDTCGSELGCCCRPAGYLLDWSRCDLFVGVASFATAGNFLTPGTSAAGQVEGSAGFQEGFNFGSRSPVLFGGELGAQFGVRAIQAHLDGSASTPDSRNQLFLTTGLFRRVDYGLQGGLVVDYFHDDWNYQADLLQLRGELSFMITPCHDLGFRFTSSQRTANESARVTNVSQAVSIKLSGLETYRFFYRYRFGELGRGQADWNAGFSENRDGVLGVNLTTPLHGAVGLQAGATCLLPSDRTGSVYSHELWNVGVALVWTPGRGFGLNRDYYRPLFDVADNGSFLTQRLQ